MKNTLVLALSLTVGIFSISAADIEIKYMVDGMNGKVPLSLAHLWGQTISLGQKTSRVELVNFEFVNQSEQERTLQISLQLVGLGDNTMQTVLLAPNEKKHFEMSPVVDPKLVSEVEDERVGKLQVEVKEGASVLLADVKNVALAGKDDIPTVVSNKPVFFFLTTRVQPKSRLVDAVLAAASERVGLKTQKGIVGYQGTPDANQMYEDVRKIYKTIQAMGFKYVNTPISFEDGFQRIKSPTEALRARTGNCIDGTLVFASCLSAVGYNPLIVIVPGHAFVVATIPPGDMDKSRPARLGLYGLGSRPNASAVNLGNVYPSILPIETTVLQAQSKDNVGLTRMTFEEAVKIGRGELIKHEAEGKITLIDVEAWRKVGLIPISDRQ